ncbi:MAG: hypothetical protein M3410_08400 [Acidobacteriota bacterium]|nr:hypothetical protein [Acidobacteriota bacterium]
MEAGWIGAREAWRKHTAWGGKPQVSSKPIHSPRAGGSINKRDIVELKGIETWMGGVHLLGRSDLWRWDDQAQKLTYL